MASNVATATADADTETASLLPRASTVGATSRRGGRTVAVVAAITAVAAVSLGGIAGPPRLAPRLGAVGARPRGAEALIGHRPGEDLWDMIDRGLTEQKVRGAAEATASERSERRASPGGAEEDGVDSPRRREETRAFDAVTEAALARMPQGQRQEARAELRRQAREAEHAKHVAERSAERRAERAELSRDRRRRARAAARASLGGSSESRSPSRFRSAAGAARAANETETTDATASSDASYEAYDDAAYEPVGRPRGATDAAAPSTVSVPGADVSASPEGSHDADAAVPDADPERVAAREEERARQRLEAEATEETARPRADSEESEKAMTDESARLDDRRDELREEIRETAASREFRREATEEALANALDGFRDDVVETSGFDQPGNRTSAERMDEIVSSLSVDRPLLEREERVVHNPEALRHELDALTGELAALQDDDAVDEATRAAQTAEVNATMAYLDAEFESDNMVDGRPPTEEERLALQAVAESVRANATAAKAEHTFEHAAAVVRAEERTRALEGTDVVPQEQFRDSLVESRHALRVSLRREEAAAEANAAKLEAQRVAEDAAAEQELAVLQAQLERVREEKERAEKREARMEARVEARRASEDAEAPDSRDGSLDEESLFADDEGFPSAAPEVSPLLEEEDISPPAPRPPTPSLPPQPPLPPPFTRADFLRARRVEEAYASEITTDADYAYVGAEYDAAVAEAEALGDEIARAREHAYESDDAISDDEAFRVAWSGAAAATATARVGSTRAAVDRPAAVVTRARTRRQHRRRRRRRDAAAEADDDVVSIEAVSFEDASRSRFDPDGGAADDAVAANAGRLGGVSRTETRDARNAADSTARADETAALSLSEASLEDLLGAKFDEEASRPADVARPGPAVAAGAAPTAFHNTFGAIPGLLEHVRSVAGPPPNRLGAERDLTARLLRMVTYANSKYWPAAKVLLRSLARVAPDAPGSLTVMLTDANDHAECAALAATLGHSCFLDADMTRLLGPYAEAEGSQAAGADGGSATPETRIGKALRVAWCWRKVHAVYTLVRGGYPALFLDASTVALADPRAFVAKRLARAELVTLSDFGGAKEQQAINTGLLAAAPDSFPVLFQPGAADAARNATARSGLPSLRERRSVRLMEEWMAYERDATDTEQAYLTWELAPVARARGDVIVALPHDRFPSYVTFDENRHVARSTDAAADAEDELSIGGITVHAAYCGSVSGKLAFMRRVEALARDPALAKLPDADELAGCDAYDRDKFRACGNAPWDGDCR